VISLPVFERDDRARIKIGAIRGGLWARFVTCMTIKSGNGWKASACHTDAISEASQITGNIAVGHPPKTGKSPGA
jgi:hypothetical protein